MRRRHFLAATAAALATMRPALALTTAEASALIDRVVADINAVINSGRSERQMYQEFARIFARYGDVPTISRFVLGPPARSASAAQLRAFTEAFQGYIARKYGRRFRELIGGRIIVQDARAGRSAVDVRAIADLRGEPPFEVVFRVSNRSGQNLFFDLVIEGISLLKAEQAEIGAMLDQRRGDLDRLIADLRGLA